MDSHFPRVIELADAQLAAYNSADLEAFLACYTEDVVVLDESGAVIMSGIAAFRDRYAQMFERFTEVHASSCGRVRVGPHLVDHELARRVDRVTGEAANFELLVRYTERDGRIAVVQMLR